jgi:ribosomal protein L30E
MIIYKLVLEKTIQSNNGVLISSYVSPKIETKVEYYARKEAADMKKAEYEAASTLLGETTLRAIITEIRVFE